MKIENLLRAWNVVAGRVTVLLTMLLLSFTAKADFSKDKLNYRVLENGESVEVYGTEGRRYGKLIIPSSVTDGDKHYTVLRIADNAFKSNEDIQSVTIPESVTEIGAQAFANCYDLRSIHIPSSIQEIGDYAFSCSHWKYRYEIAVHIIDVKAWCNIDFHGPASNPLSNAYPKLYIDGKEVSDLVIPEGVNEIKKHAFQSYYFNSITLPRSLKKIGMSAFSSYNLEGYCCENVYIPDLNCWFELKGYIPIGKYLFIGEEMLTDLVIPEGITDVFFCFNKGLKSVTFPNSMTKIETRAFDRCENLETVNIPNSVTEIGEAAFYHCNSLTKIEIPNSVTKVDDRAFNCDSLKTIILGKSISEIGEHAFANKQVKDIFIGNPVPPKTYYDENPFYSYEGTLHVPINSKKTYSENPVWGKFSKIVEFDASGVEDVTAEEGIGFSVSGGVLTVKGVDGYVIEIYDMSGRLVHTGTEPTVSGLSRGIYLLKAGNHTAKIRI